MQYMMKQPIKYDTETEQLRDNMKYEHCSFCWFLQRLLPFFPR